MHELRSVARCRAALLALALLAAPACERFDQRPREAAAAFWAALESRDLEAAQRLSTAESASELRELADGLALEDVKLDQILRNESAALVETRAALAQRDMDLEFNTHLVLVDATWRVDADATERALRRTALAVSFEEMRESIGESTDLLVEEFEERALEASEALREALEELEESLREETAPST
ncbi:MAG: hypothetical protein ACR2P8_05420 [Myxococcota bacterium]